MKKQKFHNWEGKTKGSLFGHKFFVFTIKIWGLGTAYFVLLFVSLWFVIFSRKGAKAQFYFFRKRLRYSFSMSIISVFRNHYVFGQILIDKIAILSGLHEKFTVKHTNSQVIELMIKNKTGGILINAHAGSWEAAGQLLERYKGEIYVLMLDNEHKKIKKYLSDVTGKQKIEIITIKDDGTHIIKIKNVLEKKGILAMHGDRFIDGASTIEHEFFGKKAKFPSGPFHLAAKYGVPFSFASAFREPGKHYHFAQERA